MSMQDASVFAEDSCPPIGGGCDGGAAMAPLLLFG